MKKYDARHFTDVNDAINCTLYLYDEPEIFIIPEGKKTLTLVDYSTVFWIKKRMIPYRIGDG